VRDGFVDRLLGALSRPFVFYLPVLVLLLLNISS